VGSNLIIQAYGAGRKKNDEAGSSKHVNVGGGQINGFARATDIPISFVI
jgi:hypothetical protein